MKIDARIPVAFGALLDVRPDDAVVLEGERLPADWTGIAFRPSHGILAAGCACCAPRGALAQALGDMFTARARGEVPFFKRVIAIPATVEGRSAMETALTDDLVCLARYRII